jgi:hypothetical protein
LLNQVWKFARLKVFVQKTVIVHVVRIDSGFHNYHARLRSDEELNQLLAAHLPEKYGFAVPILSVKVKRVLARLISISVTFFIMAFLRDEILRKRNPLVGRVAHP